MAWKICYIVAQMSLRIHDTSLLRTAASAAARSGYRITDNQFVREPLDTLLAARASHRWGGLAHSVSHLPVAAQKDIDVCYNKYDVLFWRHGTAKPT